MTMSSELFLAILSMDSYQRGYGPEIVGSCAVVAKSGLALPPK